MTELFQYTTCTDAVRSSADYLLKQLRESDGRILLALSGGSSLNPVRQAFEELDDETISRIHIAQIDARFVGLDSEASNWRQITAALGSKLAKTAEQARIVNEGMGPEDIAINYEMVLTGLLETCDYKIGVYGVGADGHVAGMLPTAHPETFTKFLDGRLVVNYEGADFTRITTTHAFITQLNEAVLFACGEEKLDTIKRFEEDLPPRKHPMQMLKDCQRVTMFVGETAK